MTFVAGSILHLDAALAKAGSLPGNNVDPTETWDEVEGGDGTLHGFAYTTASGWDGDGTNGDPYRLVFDGTDDYVSGVIA